MSKSDKNNDTKNIKTVVKTQYEIAILEILANMAFLPNCIPSKRSISLFQSNFLEIPLRVSFSMDKSNNHWTNGTILWDAYPPMRKKIILAKDFIPQTTSSAIKSRSTITGSLGHKEN
jgi:hypothetical protein